ncbi:MAG: FMN-binding negative transcriptional regulator [Burkholderiales bacterium]|nr:MAG: FMN-binding negative transcriptional regulator [Burkholderiales bacterium]TAG79374.1 MAG: FMN-binding negative transcriptional regulator [Betaproteobacteria bacterium]
MYIPKQFESPDRSLTLEVMRRYAFATIFTAGVNAEAIASHVPVVVEDAETLTLHFHFARANPHVAALRSNANALIAFVGPHAYMSPSVYPDLRRVPTWNYIAVHASGPVTELEGHAAKDALLKSLIGDHEPPYAEQWRGLDADFQHSLLNAIVAFRMDVKQLESKLKLNQHRKEAHAAMKSAYQEGSENERELARWMERLGL